MPRGSKDGSIIRKKAQVDSNGRTSQSAGIMVRKRFTDLKGRRREKKRCASSPSEARRLKREIEREIEAELGGIIKGSQAPAFSDLVRYCNAADFDPSEELAAFLLALETEMLRYEHSAPQLRNIRLVEYCNSQSFKPSKYFAAILVALKSITRHGEQLPLELHGDGARWAH